MRSIRLPGWLQAMVVVACLGTFGGMSYLAVGYFAMQRTIDQIAVNAAAVTPAAAPSPKATEPVAVAPSRNDTAIADLNRQLSVVSDQYAALKSRYDSLAKQGTTSNANADTARADLERRLKVAETKLSTAEVKLTAADTNNASTAQLQKTVDDLRAQLKQSEQSRISDLNELETVKARAEALKSQIDNNSQISSGAKRPQLGDKASSVSPPPSSPLAAATAYGAQVAMVQPAATQPVMTQPAVQPATTQPEAEPLVDNPEWEQHPATQTASAGNAARPMSELERLISSTGLDLDRLLTGLGNRTAQGGPFIALDKGIRGEQVDQARATELQQLIKTLPLASPLSVHYEVESPFGERHDPFNRRVAFHSGVDLGATYRSAVYSTAPGVVSFTGVKGAYGRVVEIDHGHGIVTRYAHLHRILVAHGQRVGLHTQVAELGSTGRSTGPHLHYEVLLDGRPVDPTKFLEAGKNVVHASAK